MVECRCGAMCTVKRFTMMDGVNWPARYGAGYVGDGGAAPPRWRRFVAAVLESKPAC